MAIKVANNQSLTAITALPSAVSGGAMTLLETQTASSSATLSFTSGIDDTYDEYVFKFYDIHPATNGVFFQVNFRDGGSSYDATKTTTAFRSYHDESDSTAEIAYRTGEDLAQSTSALIIQNNIDNANDASSSGYLHLFNPSNTTYVKHFYGISQQNHAGEWSQQSFISGYFNVTAAITNIQFKFSSGNINAGTIKMYGVG